MSARAAWRLERLDFDHVFRYTAGKADWKAAGLPTDGSAVPAQRALGAARRDAPTCAPAELVSVVASRVRAAGWDSCVVTNDEGVVLGRVRGGAWRAGDEHVGEVMEEGPTTTRADRDLRELIEGMDRRKVEEIIITDPDGRLLGVLRRLDVTTPRT